MNVNWKLNVSGSMKGGRIESLVKTEFLEFLKYKIYKNVDMVKKSRIMGKNRKNC